MVEEQNHYKIFSSYFLLSLLAFFAFGLDTNLFILHKFTRTDSKKELKQTAQSGLSLFTEVCEINK